MLSLAASEYDDRNRSAKGPNNKGFMYSRSAISAYGVSRGSVDKEATDSTLTASAKAFVMPNSEPPPVAAKPRRRKSSASRRGKRGSRQKQKEYYEDEFVYDQQYKHMLPPHMRSPGIHPMTPPGMHHPMGQSPHEYGEFEYPPAAYYPPPNYQYPPQDTYYPPGPPVSVASSDLPPESVVYVPVSISSLMAAGNGDWQISNMPVPNAGVSDISDLVAPTSEVPGPSATQRENDGFSDNSKMSPLAKPFVPPTEVH